MVHHDTTTASGIAAALRAGIPVSDTTFDRFLPERFGSVSERFWTPLQVAACAAMWLDELAVGDLLDIGAGPGKLCVAAALTDQNKRRYIGLEQRPELVAAGRALARDFGVAERVSFVEGTLEATLAGAVPSAEVYYLFNPFGENIAPSDEHLDASVELSDERYLRDVTATEALLANAPDGTFALVYNGFGGRVPASYEPIRIDYDLPNVLHLWVKVGGPQRSNRWPR